jgi:hypothetical protein
MDEVTMRFTREELSGLTASVHDQIVRLKIYGSPNGTPAEQRRSVGILEEILTRLMVELVSVDQMERWPAASEHSSGPGGITPPSADE